MEILGLIVLIFGSVAVCVALLLRQQAFRNRRGAAMREWGATHGLDYRQESSPAALPFGQHPFFRASRWATDVWHVAYGPDLWVADTRRAFGDSESVSIERQTVMVCRVPAREGGVSRGGADDVLGATGDGAVPEQGLDRLVVEEVAGWLLVYEPRGFTPIEDLDTRLAQVRAMAETLRLAGAPDAGPKAPVR